MSTDKQISFKLSKELHDEINKTAKKKEIATTALIRLILKEYLTKEAENSK